MYRRVSRSLAFAASIILTASAHAQTASTGGAAGAQGQGDVTTPAAQVASSATAGASAEANADVSQLRSRIIERSRKVSSQAKSKAESRLAAAAKRVDDLAAKQGEATVETRLAAEFGLTGDALASEKQSLAASWGDVMIAHTFSSNVGHGITADQLLSLRGQGMGWGQMAAGLGLDLGSAVSCVNAESRVASGLAGADGKVAMIRGEGLRAGVGADAGLKGGVDAGAAGANVNAGAGLGIKVGN